MKKNYVSKISFVCLLIFILLGALSIVIRTTLIGPVSDDSNSVQKVQMNLHPSHPTSVFTDFLNSFRWNNFIILVAVFSPDQLELLLNWKAAFEKHVTNEKRKFVVLYQHDIVYEFALKQDIPVIHFTDLIVGIDKVDLSTPLLRNQAIATSLAILSKFYGYWVVLSDVRSVFLRKSTFEFFEKLLGQKNYHFLMSSDIWEHGNFQSCCLVIKPSNISAAVFESLGKSSKIKGLSRKFYQATPSSRLRFYVFDQVLMRNEISMEQSAKPMFKSAPLIFYLSQQETSNKTKEIFKKAGFWYIND